MYFIPEVAPLLDWRTHRIQVSFILPIALAKQEKTLTLTIHVSVVVGSRPPFVFDVSFPYARTQQNLSFCLSDYLSATDLPSEESGYFILAAEARAEQPLPPVLRAMGFWVAYQTPQAYAVLPSNVQYASSRVVYGPSAEVELMDYFGGVEVNKDITTKVVFIHPYPGSTELTLQLSDATGVRGSGRALHFGPRSVQWIDIADLLPALGQEAFVGDFRVTSTHRVISYVFFVNKKTGVYYSADHTIAWIHRVVS